MRIDFRFGKNGVELNLPARFHYSRLTVCSPPPIEDVGAALSKALNHPISGPSLFDLVRGKESVAIAVCDITRPAPNAITLPPLLDVLHEAGIPDEKVSILIATGLHRAATAEEIVQIVGTRVAARYKILNHDANNDKQHRFLGATKAGTPISIDKRFVSAEVHVTLGLIEPHVMLGFSGGRKLIAPGLAHHTTIKTIHSPHYMQDVRTREGSIEDNPLHHELLEIAQMVRHDFILDVTLDHDRKISGIFTGSPEVAHKAGLTFVRDAMCSKVNAPMDAVITSAAGFPLDATFYQSGKGITAAQHIVKLGGRILLVAECAEGIGSQGFVNRLKQFSQPTKFLNGVRGEPVIADQWQLEKIAMVVDKYDVFFWVPGADPGGLGSLGTRCFKTLDEAICAFAQGLPQNATVGLVPDGPYVFARIGW